MRDLPLLVLLGDVGGQFGQDEGLGLLIPLQVLEPPVGLSQSRNYNEDVVVGGQCQLHDPLVGVVIYGPE